MNHNIKYCIWDIGKTVYPYTLKPLDEWARSHTLTPQLYTEKHNIFTYNYDPYMRGEICFDEFCTDICRQYGVVTDTAARQNINKALHKGVGAPYPETIETMHLLRRHGVENGVLSNALPILNDTLLLDDGLIDQRHIFTSYELGLLKPDPRIYQEVRRHLNCRFDEILFIDNKTENVKAACNLGMHGIICRHETLRHSVLSVLQSDSHLAGKNIDTYRR